MVLNAYGQIVYDQWLWLGRNFSFIRLDEFTVMPDHFHGILEIIDMDPVGTVREL
jgi:REP element-mobilizing transposase RayT